MKIDYKALVMVMGSMFIIVIAVLLIRAWLEFAYPSIALTFLPFVVVIIIALYFIFKDLNETGKFPY